jgi:hypothetical protein
VQSLAKSVLNSKERGARNLATRFSLSYEREHTCLKFVVFSLTIFFPSFSFIITITYNAIFVVALFQLERAKKEYEKEMLDAEKDFKVSGN